MIKALALTIIFAVVLVTFIDSHQLNQRREQTLAKEKELEFKKRLYDKQHQAPSFDEEPVNKNKTYAPDDVRVSNAVSSIRRVKGRVENYLGRNGRWPETMTEIDFKPDTSTNVHIQAIKIDRGDIFVFLKPEIGNNKIVRIYHTLDQNPYGWKCSTNIKLKGPTYQGGMTCIEEPDLSFTGTYFQ